MTTVSVFRLEGAETRNSILVFPSFFKKCKNFLFFFLRDALRLTLSRGVVCAQSANGAVVGGQRCERGREFGVRLLWCCIRDAVPHPTKPKGNKRQGGYSTATNLEASRRAGEGEHVLKPLPSRKSILVQPSNKQFHYLASPGEIKCHG